MSEPKLTRPRQQTEEVDRIRVLILNTNSNDLFQEITKRNIAHVVPNGVEIELSFPVNWPTLIVDEYTMAITIPRLLEQAERASGGEYDAVVVNQHSDPGIEALRERLDTIVVGVGETSLLLASHLAEKFSMVSVRHSHTDSMMAIDRRLAGRLGLSSKLASYRSVGGASILQELLDGESADKYVGSFVEESIRAVREDGARAIYLAGSLLGYWMPHLVEEIGKGLSQAGYGSIPVVEPMRAGLNMARLLADLKLKHWHGGLSCQLMR